MFKRANPVPRLLRGKSAVAAILDSYGGVRIIVSRRSLMKNHVRAGELCLIIDNFKVREPVPWNAVPFIIRCATDHLNWWIKTRNDPDYGGFREHVVMRQLRQSEHSKRLLHLPDICET